MALLLVGAALVNTRMARIAMHEEVSSARSALARYLRSGWCWSVIASLVLAGGVLVWPSAVDLWLTGGTYVHWSRFVVAISSFGLAATIFVIRGIDRVLDLVEARVRYLSQRP